jgi:hypothetical protein
MVVDERYQQEVYESIQLVYKGDIDDKLHLLVESTCMDSNPQYNSFRQTSNDEDDEDTNQTTPSLWSRQYQSAMMVSMGLIVFQQFSGQLSVLSYTTILFQAAGWSGNASSVATSVLMIHVDIHDHDSLGGSAGPQTTLVGLLYYHDDSLVSTPDKLLGMGRPSHSRIWTRETLEFGQGKNDGYKRVRRVGVLTGCRSKWCQINNSPTYSTTDLALARIQVACMLRKGLPVTS